jgi:DNA polymerase-3 subunit beta
MPATAKKLATEHALSLSIERNHFLKSLGRLQSIVEKRNTIPILANVKLEASKDGFFLAATDMDIVATEKVPATVGRQGAVTVPAHTLYDIIRKLPEGCQVEVESDGATGQLKIKGGKARFALSYLPADDFPVMSEGNMTHRFRLSPKELASLIDKTRFAMSTEETRYYLNGIYLHAAKGSKGEVMLKAVATDGHRLARIEAPLPAGAKDMPGIIVPRKTVAEIRKLLEEPVGEVEIAVSETKIRVDSGETILLSKLIDGTFPDYERVIPSSNDKTLEVNTKSFIAAVDRVSTIATEKTRAVKLALKAGKANLSASSPEAGTAEEEIEGTYSADTMDIGFNSRYVLEMLAQLEGENVQFLFSDPAAPVLVRDTSDAGALYVLMPMRV